MPDMVIGYGSLDVALLVTVDAASCEASDIDCVNIRYPLI